MPSTAASATNAPAASVQAAFTRDADYLERAVCSAYFERPALARFSPPVLMAAGLLLAFSPWGALPVIFQNWAHSTWLGLVLAVALLALGAAGTLRASYRATRRGYPFAGDRAHWTFAPHGISYRLMQPGGATRHQMQSDWSFFTALRTHRHGLRLMRNAQEGYFLPLHAFAADAAAMQQVVTWAQAVGLPVRPAATASLGGNRAGWSGAAVMTALLLLLTAGYALVFAALPYLRYGRVDRIFTSGVQTVWPLALAAPLVLALHAGLWHWQMRRPPPLPPLTTAPAGPLFTRPAAWPHLLLALLWCAGLLAGLHAVRAAIWEQPLRAAALLTPLTLLIGAVFALFTGWLIWMNALHPLLAAWRLAQPAQPEKASEKSL